MRLTPIREEKAFCMKQWIDCQKIVPLEVTTLWNRGSMLGYLPRKSLSQRYWRWGYPSNGSLPKVDSGVRWPPAQVKRWISFICTWYIQSWHLSGVSMCRFGTPPELPGIQWWFQASTNLLKAKACAVVIDTGPWHTELYNIVAHVSVSRTFHCNQNLLDRMINSLNNLQLYSLN